MYRLSDGNYLIVTKPAADDRFAEALLLLTNALVGVMPFQSLNYLRWHRPPLGVSTMTPQHRLCFLPLPQRQS